MIATIWSIDLLTIRKFGSADKSWGEQKTQTDSIT